MTVNYTKTTRVAHPRGVWNATGSDIIANICLVPASTPEVSDLPSVAVPSGTPTRFAGVSTAKLIDGRAGSVILDEGDEVPIFNDGGVTAGDRLTISTAGGKEGFVKTDANANVLKVGYALETAADGLLVRVKLAPKMAET